LKTIEKVGYSRRSSAFA
jgi:uncharacterized protein